MASQEGDMQSQSLITPTSTSGSDTTFPLFAKLTLEIRLMIWEFALDEPHTMIITGDYWTLDRKPMLEYLTSHKCFPAPKGPDLVTKVRAPTPDELLHTNREARQVALKKYDLVEITLYGRKMCVYFAFGSDKVVFQDHDTLSTEINPFIAIQGLLLNNSDYYNYSSWGFGMGVVGGE